MGFQKCESWIQIQQPTPSLNATDVVSSTEEITSTEGTLIALSPQSHFFNKHSVSGHHTQSSNGAVADSK